MVAVLALERAWSRVAAMAAEAATLPPRETEILLHLATHEPVRRLDAAAQLQRSTLPLEGLTARDMVVLEGPRLAKLIRLTPAGRKTAHAAAAVLAQLWAEASNGVPDDQVADVLAALHATARLPRPGPNRPSSLVTVLRCLATDVEDQTMRRLKARGSWPWETAPLRPLLLLATLSQATAIASRLGITASQVRQALHRPIAAGLIVARRPHLRATSKGLEVISTIVEASNQWWTEFAVQHGLTTLANARRITDQLDTDQAVAAYRAAKSDDDGGRVSLTQVPTSSRPLPARADREPSGK